MFSLRSNGLPRGASSLRSSQTTPRLATRKPDMLIQRSPNPRMARMNAALFRPG